MRLGLVLLNCCLIALLGCSARAGSQFQEEQAKQEKLLERQNEVFERQLKEQEDLERQQHYDKKLRGYGLSPS